MCLFVCKREGARELSVHRLCGDQDDNCDCDASTLNQYWLLNYRHLTRDFNSEISSNQITSEFESQFKSNIKLGGSSELNRMLSVALISAAIFHA